MPGPKRYFDQDEASSAPREKQHRGSGGQRGGRGGARGGGRGGARGGRAERPKKEPFKPKEGFIAGGLKAYADAAAEAKDNGTEDAASHQTTLYLSNLPSTLTSPQLTLIFSSYAPVRAAFVVSQSAGPKADAPSFAGSTNAISVNAGRDRTGKSQSRGFGYVRFVLRPDAEQCLKEWGTPEGILGSTLRELRSQEGLEGVEWDKLSGPSGMKMSWAKKKLREGEKPEGGDRKAARKEKKAAAPVEAAEEDEVAQEGQKSRWRPGVWDHNAPRTVVVLGLPLPGEAGSTEEAGEAEEEDEKDEKMAVDAEEGEPAASEAGPSKPKGKPIDWKKALKQRAKKVGDVEDVLWPYELPSGETGALVIMYTPRHAHDLMSKLNNHVFRGVLVSAAVKSTWDLCQRLGRGKGGGRLLVRNLGFDVTVADLRAAFSRFGPLHSINLPVDASTSRPRGFAFVYFVTKSQAETALKAINGSRIYAGMADERIASEGGKEGKKKEVREKKKAEKKEQGGGGGDKGRLVAVDWALGQADWKKAQDGGAEEADGDDNEASASDDGSDEEESGSEDEEDSDMSPVPEGEDSEEEDEDSDTEPVALGAAGADEDDGMSDIGEPKQQQQGTTLFVRNMSFEATEAELYDLFKSFGPLRYARIVYDPTTKRSRGTAFICFWNDADARSVLEASKALNEGSFGETSNKKSTSLLMADPSSSTASRLTLHGRVLAAVPAVSKNDADKLREDRDKKGASKTDRRNLYLMREGVIFPSWAIAKTLSAADLDARQSSFDARKQLLRSNPSLYISRNRLSIRQIPLYVSDGMLKRLANHAMREFDRDVKSGYQKPLTSDELIDFVADASGAKEPASTKVERRKGIPLSRVRQSKILRQNDRVDPVTGLGRSKGYGFLELATHADALRFLRWANANKEVNSLFRMWWREALEKMIESVENGEGKMGKNVKAKDKDDRLSRLREKQKELEEEEKLAQDKAAKREAVGKAVTGESGRSSKCLIIEFSIENAVTTKRRAEKADRAREKARRAKERAENGEPPESEDEADSDAETEATSATPKKGGKRDKKSGGKKRKADEGDETASPSKKRTKGGKSEEKANEGEKSEGARIGSLIGRKRKMKKGGR
ncbi:hypothetical protein JCM11641_003079 [Rhodosporidiobolus odoratus]